MTALSLILGLVLVPPSHVGDGIQLGNDVRVLAQALPLSKIADPFSTDEERNGRRGNALYEDEAWTEAAETYAGGIAGLSSDAKPRIRYGLHNNLGAALLRSGDSVAALRHFELASRENVPDADLARSTYNAGNAAYTTQNLEAALEHYRQSLLRNPDNEDAKFNYEFVKRQLARQQREQQQNPEQQQDEESSQSEDEQQSEGDQEQEQQGQREQEQQEQQGPSEGSEQEQPPSEEEQNQEDPSPEDSQESPEESSAAPSEERLSQAEAERILQALRQEEEKLLREVRRMEAPPRRVDKDW